MYNSSDTSIFDTKKQTTIQVLSNLNAALGQWGIEAWIIDVPSRTGTRINKDKGQETYSLDFAQKDKLALWEQSIGKIYPEDLPIFYELFPYIWQGREKGCFKARQWSNKYQNYAWFEFAFTLIESRDGKPLTAIGTIRDIMPEKNIERLYQEQITSRDKLETSIIAYCRLNITKGIVEDMSSGNKNFTAQATSEFADRYKLIYAKISLTKEEIEDFSLASLKKKFAEGIHRVEKRYWAVKKVNNEPMWLCTDCQIVERPETGDIIAFFYNRDCTYEHLVHNIIRQLSANSYERAAVIFMSANRVILTSVFSEEEPTPHSSRSYEETTLKYCEKYIPPRQKEDVKAALSLQRVKLELEGRKKYTVTYDIVEANGEPKRKKVEFTYLDRDNDVVLMTRSDMALYKELRYLSEHDPLTGIYNRAHVLKLCKEILDKNPDKTFILLKADLSNFKLYNSFYGEEEGDRLLKYAAEIIADVGRTYQFCVYGRLQSDIFGLFAEYDPERVTANIKRANRALVKYRSDYRLKFSIGACLLRKGEHTIEEALARASIASRRCKENVNLSYVIYDEQEETKQRQELFVLNNMQKALVNKEFLVYLQPKYAIEGDRPYGAEALVRWLHPEKGMLLPSFFIPIFEQNGFIASLDLYMWEQTCALLRQWLDEGYQPQPVSVNLSRVSLYNPNIVKLLSDILLKYGLTTKEVYLEITESAYMTDQVMMRRTINAFHRAGFVIMMDDFGSGYSSLNTLKEFHIDILKIDMKFLPHDKDVKRAEIILASMIRMAKWLGMDVVMEGVETQAQRTFLQGVNCDYIQGYYYAKPMPAEEYAQKYVYIETNNVNQAEENFLREIKTSDEILLVTGDEVSKNNMLHVLNKDYLTRCFSTAEDCLAYLKTHYANVGLIIADKDLSGMDGLDFLEYCKNDTILKLIPKIFITSDISTDCYVKSVVSGVDAFLLQPLKIDNFLACVRKCMERSGTYTVDAMRHILNYLDEPAAIFVFSGDKAYFEYANTALYEMFATNKKAATGLSFEQIVFKTVDSRDVQVALDMLQTIKDKGSAQSVHRACSLDGKHYWVQVQGKIIEDNQGKTVYFTFTDITAQREMIEREQTLTKCYELLTSQHGYNVGVDKVLAQVRQYYQANRVYIFKFDREHHTMSNTREFVAQGVTKEIANLQNLPMDWIDFWLPFYQRNEAVYIDDVAELKQYPERVKEYEALVAQNITCLMTVPIIYNNVVYGYIGIDDPKSCKKDKALLCNLSAFISREFYYRELREKYDISRS